MGTAAVVRWLRADARDVVRVVPRRRPGPVEAAGLRPGIVCWEARLSRRRLVPLLRRQLLLALGVAAALELAAIAAGGGGRPAVLVAPALLAVLGVRWGLRTRPGLLATARVLDRDLALAARTATAVELGVDGRPPGVLPARVVVEASAGITEGLGRARAVARGAPAEWAALLGAAAVVGLLLGVPPGMRPGTPPPWPGRPGSGAAAQPAGSVGAGLSLIAPSPGRREPRRSQTTLRLAADRRPETAATHHGASPAPAQPAGMRARLSAAATLRESRAGAAGASPPAGRGGRSPRSSAPPLATRKGAGTAAARGRAGTAPGRGGAGHAQAGSTAAARRVPALPTPDTAARRGRPRGVRGSPGRGSRTAGRSATRPRRSGSGHPPSRRVTGRGAARSSAAGAGHALTAAGAGRRARPGAGGHPDAAPGGAGPAGRSPGGAGRGHRRPPRLQAGGRHLSIPPGYATSRGDRSAAGAAAARRSGGGTGPPRSAPAAAAAGPGGRSLPYIPPTANLVPAPDQPLLIRYFSVARWLLTTAW